MNKEEILINFAKVYNDYLAECDVYDGASLWGSERAKKCLDDLDTYTKQIIEKERVRCTREIAAFVKRIFAEHL